LHGRKLLPGKTWAIQVKPETLTGIIAEQAVMSPEFFVEA